MPNGKQYNVPAKKLPITKRPKSDWRSAFSWRVFRIMSEFVEGFQVLADFRKTVTFFGSARLTEDNPWYQETRKLARMLAKQKFSIITGGGPGIMEAANRGAHDVNGDSIGLNIQLPMEQRVNPYVKKSIGFHYFFTRKVILAYSSQAYVFFPGGYGTVDELFEILTLIQTRKIFEKIPVVLVGKEFWGQMDAWIKKTMLEQNQVIDQEDIRIYSIVNSAEEAFKIVLRSKHRDEFPHR